MDTLVYRVADNDNFVTIKPVYHRFKNSIWRSDWIGDAQQLSVVRTSLALSPAANLISIHFKTSNYLHYSNEFHQVRIQAYVQFF